MALGAQNDTLSIARSADSRGADLDLQQRSAAMSATITPPATVDAPLDTAAQAPRAVAAPARIRMEPDVASARRSRPSVPTERFREVLFTATWIPALAVASAFAAVVLAVSQPIVIAGVLYRQRRYR
jgi:hypothetical protein